MISKFKIVIDNVSYDIERKSDLLVINGQEFPFRVDGTNIQISGNPHTASLTGKTATIDGISYAFTAVGLEEKRQMSKRKAASKTAADEAGAVSAIMPGLIIKILKHEGDTVAKGDVILILEAMKMQNELQAPRSGTIRQVNVKVGDSVEMRQVLAVIE